MKWSWKIGQLAGIGLYVHVTFFLLIGWIAVNYWNMHHTLLAVFAGIGFIVSLFACVVLHELGHALAARRFGIATKDITLLPIGGVARLERIPKEPKQELIVAIAGPLVNLVIAAAIYVALLIGGTPITAEGATIAGGPFLTRLLLVNVILVVFNLLPAFPMDGGRVLRALLATRMDYATATERAARVGQMMALLFGVLGLMGNPFLVFIALFVWIGAAAEAGAVRIRSALNGIPVRSAMLTEFKSLETDMSLTEVIDWTLSSAQKDFPVVQAGVVVGVLTQSDILESLAKSGPNATVGDVMRTEFQFAHSHDMLEGVLDRFQQGDVRVMPVTRGGQLVGLITMDNISELILYQGAIKESGSQVFSGTISRAKVLPSTPPKAAV